VTLDGRPLELTQKEFALLRVLAADPVKVHTKDELLRTVWGFRSRGSSSLPPAISPAGGGILFRTNTPVPATDAP
jgi:DNA-binding winged helix-turn-helix (wHTH) protein